MQIPGPWLQTIPRDSLICCLTYLETDQFHNFKFSQHRLSNFFPEFQLTQAQLKFHSIVINCSIDRLINEALFVFCLHYRNGGSKSVHQSMFSEHMYLIVHYDVITCGMPKIMSTVNKINHQRKLIIQLQCRYLVTSIHVRFF